MPPLAQFLGALRFGFNYLICTSWRAWRFTLVLVFLRVLGVLRVEAFLGVLGELGGGALQLHHRTTHHSRDGSERSHATMALRSSSVMRLK